MKAVRSERTGDRDLRFPLRSVWKVNRSGIGPAWKAVGACKGMEFNSLSFRCVGPEAHHAKSWVC